MGHLYRFSRTTRRELIDAAATAAVTSLLFIVVYGGSSWITSLRSDVSTWVFAWESVIPFVPWLIIPYMSIDLFFVGAPFVCTDQAERRLFAKRIGLAILVAGTFFLLMPLRYAFPRPVPEGWLGAIFTFLHGFDRPYNLFPSLHIALRTILADTYARHTRGNWRWLVQIWFSLIGISTLLTYQHHVVDVVGGFILAVFCFYLIREPSANPRTINHRVGHYYAGAASLLGIAALAIGGWGYLLFWPATALAMVSGAYFGLINDVFRKRDGCLPLSTRCIFAPVLFGHWLSLRYYQLKGDPWNEILPGLWLGRRLTNAETKQAVDKGITAVLDLTSEFSEPQAFLATRYLNLPVLDLTAPLPEQLVQAAEFIRRERAQGKVYVHCKIGYSRSAAVVGTYLLATGAVSSAEEAIAFMRRARPFLIVRPEVVEALQQVKAYLTSAEMPDITKPRKSNPKTATPRCRITESC